MTDIRIRQAGELAGVSDDTVRRWIDDGKLSALIDGRGRQVVQGSDLAALMVERATVSGPPNEDHVPGHSVRNRLTGIVTAVLRDTVMAQVDVQVGSHRFVSLISREAADELALAPGSVAVVSVKSTNVSIDVPT
jgi:molybdopterin-binding protein